MLEDSGLSARTRIMPTTKRRHSAIGKRLLWLGATLLVLEIAYVIFGNLFLCFGLRRLVNSSPETVLLDYESGYTLWPGTASVHRFRLRNQDSHIQWVLEVEHADFSVDLLAFFRRTFHAPHIRAEGVSFRLRTKLTMEGAAAPRAGAFPPIEGYDDPPLEPIGPPELPVTDANYDVFTVNLEDTDATVRELWIDELRLVGPAHVNGRWFFKPMRKMQLGPVAVDTESGALEVGGKSVLTSLALHLRSTVGLVDLHGALEPTVREISGRGTVDAKLTNVEFARLYLGSPPALRIDDGSGTLEVAARIEHGRAMAGTVASVKSDHVVLGTKGVEATAALACEVRVDASRAGPVATGDLHVIKATVVLASRDGEPPVVEAAHARFRGLPRDLAGSADIEHTQLDVPVRFPDLGWLLPRPDKGAARTIGLTGSGAVRAKVELDRHFHGAGSVEAHADDVAVKAAKLGATAGLSATVGFDSLDWATKSLVFRPSSVTAERVAITREGRTHGGGSARVDLGAGRIDDGRPRDLELTIAARHPDLSWLAVRATKKGGLGAVLRSGEAHATVQIRSPDALFDASAADAAITGTLSVSASGDARLADATLRGNVTAAGTLEALDLGRQTLHVRRMRVTARDVSIDRGSDRAVGWWADVNVQKLDASLARSTELATHADLRCRDGAPFLAVLVGGGQIPGWVPSLFPMKRLTASADLRVARAVADLDLRVRSTTADVTARLHDLGGAIDGAILVKTGVVSVGVALARGESHTTVFAGEDWLKAKADAVAREEALPALGAR